MFVLSTKTMNTNTKSATKKSNQNQFLFFFSAAVLSAGDYPLVALQLQKHRTTTDGSKFSGNKCFITPCTMLSAYC